MRGFYKQVFNSITNNSSNYRSYTLAVLIKAASLLSLTIIQFTSADAQDFNFYKINEYGELINQNLSPAKEDNFFLDTPEAKAVTIDTQTRLQPKKQINPEELSLEQQEQELLKKMGEQKQAEPEAIAEAISGKVNQKPAETAQTSYGDQDRREEIEIFERLRNENLNRAKNPAKDEPLPAQAPAQQQQIDTALPPAAVNKGFVNNFEMGEAVEKQGISQEKFDKLEADNLKIQKQLSVNLKRVEDLTKKLDEAKRQLMLAETQVERLSKIIESRNIESTQQQQPEKAVKAEPKVNASRQNKPQRREGSETTSEGDSLTDFEKFDANDPSLKIGVPKNTQSNSLTPILTITVERALLRLAPSDESSVVTTLDKGTKVTAEKRQGEWYQIISPDGVRAWVKATSVGQGSLNRSRTGEFLPQRDYSSNSMDTDESRALDLLRRR